MNISISNTYAAQSRTEAECDAKWNAQEKEAESKDASVKSVEVQPDAVSLSEKAQNLASAKSTLSGAAEDGKAEARAAAMRQTAEIDAKMSKAEETLAAPAEESSGETFTESAGPAEDAASMTPISSLPDQLSSPFSDTSPVYGRRGAVAAYGRIAATGGTAAAYSKHA